MDDGLCLSFDQQCALNCALSGFDMCIFGEGGTGKTYILKIIIEKLKEQGKSVLVCAPTGVAASEINGSTIHRVFSYPSTAAINASTNTLKIHATDVVRVADVVIIEEISMVRVDYFDSVISSIREAELEKNGGKKKQIILCGDPFQLPPFVATPDEWQVLDNFYGRRIDPPWFFLGKTWETCSFKIIRLKEIFRQADPEFKRNLNLLRNSDSSCIQYFNDNCVNAPDPEAVYLLSDNEKVRTMNNQKLNALPGQFYDIPTIISDSLTSGGKAQRRTTAESQPVRLKEGCRIMITANDINCEQRAYDVVDYLTDVPKHKRRKNLFVNGSMGIIESIKIFPDRHRNDSIFVRLDDNPDSIIQIFRYEYPVNEYVVENGSLVLKQIGTISRIPVMPAYAFTIHKSQGKTFRKVNVDPRCSGYGQLYVAVSRAETVENLHLLCPIQKTYMRTDPVVAEFMEGLPDDRPLFAPSKRGPKPKLPERELGEPAKSTGKRGRKKNYGDDEETKAIRVPVFIADWLSYSLNVAYPKDKSVEPDLVRLKKLISLINKTPIPKE